MGNDRLKVRINPIALTSISAFKNISGQLLNLKKDVYFFRYLGIENEKKYRQELKEAVAEIFTKDYFESYIDSELVSKYSKIYKEWRDISPMMEQEIIDVKFPFKFKNKVLEYTLKESYRTVLQIYFKTKKANESITRNFGIKLLHWIDLYFPKIFKETDELKKFPKVIYTGELKLQEYLFLYMLVLLGCDVLCADSQKRKVTLPQELLKLSTFFEEPQSKKIEINIPIKTREREKISLEIRTTREEIKVESENRVTINLERNKSKRKTEKEETYKKEISYEELAQLASSVVMISVFNRKKERIKTGSGVIINNRGHILTNFHVISEGYYYGVRLENDETMYMTSEIVKYHDFNDLALIKIEKIREHIDLYREERELVRGQKVVAIGSPLGLFNSVSDGIISGFRMIDDLAMIQFTAPISHGSSGGALLDLRGKLVGIITAGFDKGQNINLAVDYRTIYNFIKGFI